MGVFVKIRRVYGDFIFVEKQLKKNDIETK